ncbi:hypothetical protein OWV82_019942 [Melia azedarach]|uniref:Uncharacterized protein n=1 Tax=Melia azedarach TaxID=155640 RepID=A0ACC1X4N0_MELAZ|nr:hypothetical protein OWV82_019942 [Melia azedarach]
MEKHRGKMVCEFANNDQKKLEEAYAQVMELAKFARECYEDNEERRVAKFNDEEFTKMMFLDGCFVVQFIYCCTRTHKQDGNQDDDQPNSTILQKLMMLKFQNDKETWETKLGNFIEKTLGPRHNYSKQRQAKPQQDHQQTIVNMENEPEPAHLLAYTQTKLIGKEKLVDKSTERKSSSCWSSFLSAMDCNLWGICCKPSKSHPSSWSSYRSAMELKLVGINFKPSKSHQLRSVEFRELILRDELYLPPMTVDDSTKSLLLNMVAYEACADSPSDFVVTSYICFLDSLIDHAADVKELRSKSILHNFLGSDEHVAILFNEIADNLVPNGEIYPDINKKIEKHYKGTGWLSFGILISPALGPLLHFLEPYLPSSSVLFRLTKQCFPQVLLLLLINNHTQLNPPHN